MMLRDIFQKALQNVKYPLESPTLVHIAVEDHNRILLESLPQTIFEGTDTMIAEILEKNALSGAYEVVGSKKLKVYVYAVPPAYVAVGKFDDIDFWVRGPDHTKTSSKWRRIERIRGKVKGKEV